MKIGIMTFWWSEDNYGQILQCYALQRYLRDVGHDAYLIRYSIKDIVKTPVLMKILKAANLIRLARFILRKIRIALLNKENERNPRNFETFRNKYIKQSEKIYNSYQELSDNPPEADVYIVGSDQVWYKATSNLSINSFYQKAFFLDFGSRDIVRIAYAASFSRSTVDPQIVKSINYYLNKFKYISVREEEGLEICQQCGIQNVEISPDPSILLAKDDYRMLYKDINKKEITKEYCFVYVLANKCNVSIKEIHKWAKEKKINIIYVTGNSKYDKYKKYYPNIPEWLHLIDNAEYVITNSYHGMIFSLIFNKRFVAIPLSGIKYETMNTRIYSIANQFGLQDRILEQGDAEKINELLNTEIDYSLINEEMARFSNKGKCFLNISIL
jgi:polysaccharide pyruvyl transferase WcaK-like protein